MRKLVTGARWAVILMICFSCKSSKQASSLKKEESKRIEEKAIKVTASRRLETEYLGDSLTGRMPLPYTVPYRTSFKVESSGINLELTLQDSTIEYRAVAKPVARSSLSREDSSYQQLKLEEFQQVTQTEESTKKKTGFPWWIWPILAIGTVIGILIKINRIKIF